MSFLSEFEEIVRVPLGGDWWVDVKSCVSQEEKEKADAVLGGRQTIEVNGRDGRQFATMDYSAYRREMVVASIVDWNLTDGNGVMALAPEQVARRNIARLPSKIFDKIYAKVDELNGEQPQDEQVRFPDSAGVSDSDGVGGAADPVEVPAGAAVVAATWHEAGGFGAAPLA